MKSNEHAFGFIGCMARRAVGAAEIIDVFGRMGIRVQPLRAGMVFGKEHLESACLHALRAVERGEGASDDIMAEVALYTGCSRQLSRSLSLVRIEGDREIVMVTMPEIGESTLAAILEELGLERDDALMELTEGKLTNAPLLGIEEKDVAAVREAVLEKIALVDVER